MLHYREVVEVDPLRRPAAGGTRRRRGGLGHAVVIGQDLDPVLVLVVRALARNSVDFEEGVECHVVLLFVLTKSNSSAIPHREQCIDLRYCSILFNYKGILFLTRIAS